MNGFLLAAIVLVVLLIAGLLLKKRSSLNKTSQIEADDRVETAAGSIEPTPLKSLPVQPDSGREPGEPTEAVPADAAEASVASLDTEAVSAADLVVFDLEEPLSLASIEEDLLLVEPGEAAAEFSQEAIGEIEKISVAPEGAEPVSSEFEQAPAQGDKEEEVPVITATPSAADVKVEESVLAVEPFVAEEPVVLQTAVAAVSPSVRLTLDAYSMRLNSLEEQQRALLAQAIQRRDDKKRDQLQRELVIMNDKLALLADSYADELLCYQQVLDALADFQGEADDAELASAKEGLQEGEPQVAENFLAGLSERPHPFAAQAAFHSGQLAFCRVDLQKALELFRRAVELEPKNTKYLQAAGKTARRLYHYKEALSWLESFVRLSREQKDGQPLDLALAQRELAYTYVLSGQYQKAGPLYKESMTVLAKQLGPDHPEMATSWYQIGELQETLGEYDKAVSLYKKSLEILEKKRGQDHPVLANILDKLAALCMELEMEKQAVPLYQRLVRIREKALRPTHPQLALSLNNLAESFRLQGQYAEAEACYQKSLVINETIHGTEHPSVAAVLQELAKLCNSQRKPEEAEQYQQRATAIFQKSVEASEKKTGQEALTLEI